MRPLRNPPTSWCRTKRCAPRRSSAIQVEFVDGSQLSVEQSSEMVLSDYVFDGTAAAGLINLNDGLFHFTSNGKPDQGVKLRTPVATIGVRGTETWSMSTATTPP